jgi:hypothetical protein
MGLCRNRISWNSVKSWKFIWRNVFLIKKKCFIKFYHFTEWFSWLFDGMFFMKKKFREISNCLWNFTEWFSPGVSTAATALPPCSKLHHLLLFFCLSGAPLVSCQQWRVPKLVHGGLKRYRAKNHCQYSRGRCQFRHATQVSTATQEIRTWCVCWAHCAGWLSLDFFFNRCHH